MLLDSKCAIGYKVCKAVWRLRETGGYVAETQMQVQERDMAVDPSRAEATVLHDVAMSAFQRGSVEVALRFMSRACVYPEAPAMWHRNHAEILDRSGNSEAAETAARLAV